ncbi:MAG: SGNH/GDSL hydrolase family protein [Clostridia bacterium]|nr:SGNH/GDSL hydrolase family protein [Clostridia bacterium]
MQNDMLYGKTLVALGDSLIYGNKLGNAVTWPNLLGAKCGMTVHNFGQNGNPIAQPEEASSVPMCIRYAEMPDEADYVVVLGGANDKRLHVPLGENDSRDIHTFKGALNVLIEGLTAKYPKAKILFMTNYNRYPSKNRHGLSDIDYVTAMEEICAIWAIPCFNNYKNSGISFQNKNHVAWIDEGVALGIGENHHFSAEGYLWLLPKYEALLRSL